MRASSRVVRRLRPAAGLLLALTVTTGCVGMPDTGPVVTTEGDTRVVTGGDPEFRPLGPLPGMSPQSIVERFLTAMTATPVRTDVAQSFLANDAQTAWEPGRRTITYEGLGYETVGDNVRANLTGARWVDAQGQWRGDLGDGTYTVDFPMIQEQNEQWRIARAPDALIVPNTWFEESGYRQASVYYLDPTASILVPELVFVPQGDQLATSLVEALLAGPGPRLVDVCRTFVPAGLTPGLSVPVSSEGIASITLEGDPGQMTPQATKLMVYQFAWTLRQDPTVRGFRITIGNEPVTLETGNAQFSVELGSEYDPTAVQASPQLFSLRNGLLVSGSAESSNAVGGPFGSTEYGIRDIGVSLTAGDVAAVSSDGSSVLLGPASRQGSVDTVVSGATDLLPPAWDFSDRLWILDRNGGRATVSTVDADGSVRPVRVRGITGKDVEDFMVSRDSTRLVAVVRGRRHDELRQSRIRHDTQGRILGATRSRALEWGAGDARRIRDIGWRSPTMVAVLHLLTKDFAQVVSVPVDGSPGREDALSQGEPARALVSSPVANETLYTLTSDGLLDPTGDQGGPFPLVPVTTVVHYVG